MTQKLIDTLKKKLPLQVVSKGSEWLSGIKCNNSVKLN